MAARHWVVWILFAALAATSVATMAAHGSEKTEVPVKGIVTLVDLGAKSCIPCKMMAPILEKLEKEYRGRAAIVFIDVWQDKAPAQRFEIRAIPTQIFSTGRGRRSIATRGL